MLARSEQQAHLQTSHYAHNSFLRTQRVAGSSLFAADLGEIFAADLGETDLGETCVSARELSMIAITIGCKLRFGTTWAKRRWHMWPSSGFAREISEQMN